MRYCSACAAPLPQPPPVTCDACGVEHYRNAKPCAGVLIMRDGKLLLLRRSTDPWLGWWDIPGGFCDEEEHPRDAARREAKEEVGLDVEITGFVGMWLDKYPDPAAPERPVTTLNAYYHAVAAPGAEPSADQIEASEVGWFAPDDLPEEIAFPHHARMVLEAWRADVSAGRTVDGRGELPG